MVIAPLYLCGVDSSFIIWVFPTANFDRLIEFPGESFGVGLLDTSIILEASENCHFSLSYYPHLSSGSHITFLLRVFPHSGMLAILLTFF